MQRYAPRSCRKILVFLQKSVAMLAPSNPELALKLYLEIAVATDGLARSTAGRHEKSSAEQTSIAYDFLTQAFLVYDDEISDPAAQVRSITSIVGSLLACETFEDADYEALITKTAQFSAKLLKKPDQCRMVCLCSRLFYVGGEGVSARERGSGLLLYQCDFLHYSLLFFRRMPPVIATRRGCWNACSGDSRSPTPVPPRLRHTCSSSWRSSTTTCTTLRSGRRPSRTSSSRA